MSKQDRTSSRTPTDTERKYLVTLGKSFAEIMGIATDARILAEQTGEQLSTEIARLEVKISETAEGIILSVEDVYATNESVASQIAQTEAAISAKVSQTGNNADSSFAWQLLKDSFTLLSNGKEVFKVNKNGAFVDGLIYANSGKIGGWDLGVCRYCIKFADSNGPAEYKTEIALHATTIEDISGGAGTTYYENETWITPSGVCVHSQYYAVDGGYSPMAVTYKTWRQILSGA